VDVNEHRQVRGGIGRPDVQIEEIVAALDGLRDDRDRGILLRRRRSVGDALTDAVPGLRPDRGAEAVLAQRRCSERDPEEDERVLIDEAPDIPTGGLGDGLHAAKRTGAP
jgi:hypothetical protein